VISTFDREKGDPNALNTALLRSEDLLLRDCWSVDLELPQSKSEA